MLFEYFFCFWIGLKLKVVERTFVYICVHAMLLHTCFYAANKPNCRQVFYGPFQFVLSAFLFFIKIVSFHFGSCFFLGNSFIFLEYRSLDDLILGYLLFHLLKSVRAQSFFFSFEKTIKKLKISMAKKELTLMSERCNCAFLMRFFLYVYGKWTLTKSSSPIQNK